MKKGLRILPVLAFSFFCLTSNVSADNYNDCCDPCGPCEPALCPGSFNVQVHAGIAPRIFADRDVQTRVSSAPVNCPTTGPLATTVVCSGTDKHPKFGKLFNQPGFIVGGQIGYAICANDCGHSVEVYLEADYSQQNGKTTKVNENIELIGQRADFEKFRQVSVHVGWRYYWCRMWCDRVAPFVGTKTGYAHRKKVEFTLPDDDDSTTKRTWFEKTNTVSGGVHVGFDWCIWDCLSFIFIAEVVASGCLKGKQCLLFAPVATANQANFVNGPGVLVTFPVKFGFRWYF